MKAIDFSLARSVLSQSAGGRAEPRTVGGPLYAASIQMQTKLHNGRTREGRRISNVTDLAHMRFTPHE